jgi:hypothetical protein
MTKDLIVIHNTPDANICIRQTGDGRHLAHELSLGRDASVASVRMSYAGLLDLRGALNSYLRALDSTPRG